MSELHKRSLTSLFLFVILFLSYSNVIILFSVLFVISFLAILEFNFIVKKICASNRFFHSLILFLLLVYTISFSTIIWINFTNIDYNNKFNILFLLTICIATDIGGYAFGKVIGGKKLSIISPNKTYSGVCGSILVSLLSGYVFFLFLDKFMSIEKNIFVLIIVISIVSQIGDLLISKLKRLANLKDTGSILPGHGGILDRIDGILLAIPFGIIFISY